MSEYADQFSVFGVDDVKNVERGQVFESGDNRSGHPSIVDQASREASGSRRHVGQPEHLANAIAAHKAEWRSRTGEVRLAVANHHRVQVDSVLVDQAKVG